MATFFELNRSALQLMEQSGTLAKNLGFEVAAGSIQGQIDAFQKKKLMVVVAGEARRGKSSLLNALLNEAQPLFPVDINVCTNVVTIVQYGEQEKSRRISRTRRGNKAIVWKPSPGNRFRITFQSRETPAIIKMFSC